MRSCTGEAPALTDQHRAQQGYTLQGAMPKAVFFKAMFFRPNSRGASQ